MKAVKNFKCNGVSKKAGELLSKADKDKIGEKMGKELLDNDFIMISSPAKEKVEPKKEAPKKKEVKKELKK